MDLFDHLAAEPLTVLDKDGIVNYYGPVLPLQHADEYLHSLLTRIAWQHDEAIIRGNRIQTRRKVAWYADSPFDYTYSGITRRALPWIDELRELKALVEDRSGETFNSCLLNLYHDGSEAMAWHCDAETDLKKHAAIGSLSLGAERKFSFKHRRTKETVSLLLQHGSLLVMKGETQTHWLHSLPRTTTVATLRVNLTFRTIVEKN